MLPKRDRQPAPRATHVDYDQGVFHVVFRTRGGLPLGTVTADGFVPSSIGELLNSAWRKLDDRDDLTVHEFQVMPDHTHGTVELLGGYELGSLVRRLKSQVTRLAAPNAVRWQRSFYDRRIRTEGDLLNVCEYIRNNPAAWWAKFGG